MGTTPLGFTYPPATGVAPAGHTQMQTLAEDVDDYLSAAWTAYTPTWTNVTVGNGTVLARYGEIGKWVQASITLTLGSTSSVGSGGVYLSLPVTLATGATVTNSVLGSCGFQDSSAGAWRAGAAFRNGSNARLIMADGTNLSATAPWTWATGDLISVLLAFERA